MDSKNRELDFLDKVLEKAIESNSKASLQPVSGTCEIDASCFRSWRPTKKDETIFSFKFSDSKENHQEKLKPANTISLLTLSTQFSEPNPRQN